MTAIELRGIERQADRALVERARDGDRQAFGQLIEPRVPTLYRSALSILRHEADANDAVQQACVDAWRELPRLRDPDRFDAWLGRTLVNRCRMILRSHRRVSVREVSVDTLTTEPGGRDRATDDWSGVDAIRRAFGRLSADHRIALVLHHVEERPVAEMAALLGVAEGTVKWRLHEARRALQRALQREDA
jgi:RNA polymerase sigma-70 factor (ECF subfamily)